MKLCHLPYIILYHLPVCILIRSFMWVDLQYSNVHTWCSQGRPNTAEKTDPPEFNNVHTLCREDKATKACISTLKFAPHRKIELSRKREEKAGEYNLNVSNERKIDILNFTLRM